MTISLLAYQSFDQKHFIQIELKYFVVVVFCLIFFTMETKRKPLLCIVDPCCYHMYKLHKA